VIIDRPGERHLHVVGHDAGKGRGRGKVGLFQRCPATGAYLRPIPGGLEHIDIGAAASLQDIHYRPIRRVLEGNRVGVEIDKPLPGDHAKVKRMRVTSGVGCAAMIASQAGVCGV
jgi:hypothetical protein